MGLFQDSFKVGAGATLGSLATVSLFNIGEGLVDAASRNAYNNYRSQYFDPVVRADLCDIMVKESLPQRAYPFPNGNPMPVKKQNIFMRHKILTVLAVLTVWGTAQSTINVINDGGDPSESFALVYVFTLIALSLGSLGAIAIKIVKAGGKAFAKTTYKNQLADDGQQYWYIREYIRQALAMRQLTKQEAVVKISNTRLAQQFPDTLEELDAHAFYYQQRLGLI